MVAQGIITAAHVVQGADTVEVFDNAGHQATAQVQKTDGGSNVPGRDVALLTTSLAVPPVDLEPATTLQLQQDVYAFGFPLSGPLTVQNGRVTADLLQDIGNNRTLIEFNAPINPGNSGGPLVDTAGKVVGIVTESVRDAQGTSYAVSSDSINDFLVGLVASGPAPSPAPVPLATPLAPSPAPSPAPTSVGPVPTPYDGSGATTAAAPGTILLSETFDDPSDGVLPTQSSSPDQWAQGYNRGAYYILGRSPIDAIASAHLPGTYGDASMAVESYVGSSDSTGSATVVYLGCREKPGIVNTGYRFVTSPSTGQFTLMRADSADQSTYTYLQQWTGSPAIRSSGEWNRLDLVCTGTSITAFINNVLVATAQDNTYLNGVMWLGASADASGANPSTPEAWFDNLVVEQR